MKNYLNFENNIKNLETELDKLKNPYNKEGLSEVDTQKISEISNRLSEGEILQIENAINKDMTENTYFKMISDKTASLLSASCLLGYISTSNGKKKSNIKKFGEYLGISYQLLNPICLFT